MADPPPPPPANKGVLSLYDNLVDPNDTSATISSAPVRYDQQSAPEATPATVKKPIDPALRFQPTRRPQIKTNKPKSTPKAPSQPPTPAVAQQPPAPQEAAGGGQPPPPPQKSSLADWAATEDDEWRYRMGEKRQRGGRKKKKKQHVQVETDWDDVYDPTRPTNVDEFLRSDERIDEVREWKSLLYRHRNERKRESDLSDDSEEDTRPAASNQFAPPPSYNFAPPPPQSPPAPPPETLPPPPPEDTNTSTISAAPIRYSQPTFKNDDEDQGRYSPPPSLTGSPGAAPTSKSLPGQAGFAQRLMSKYGWTSGTGLGASSSGIINPLHVKVEKRKKRADADGGGWADPANKGKILGGQRAAPVAGDEARSTERGKMSEVIVLENMLENMPDLQEEISAGLGQEIGEECGEKYGRVERLYIDQTRRQVFIKFTDQISALRAVNELDGRVFNGNTIVPKYYDTEKFEQGIYS
ncbi:g-patch domain-containing protein [Sarocladium implicatum]|nr:g-patch domain-containing protein [Sarocladium implicatum]